jgi:hypothetical protein
LSGGLLGTPLKTSAIYAGSHSPSISANGTSNGVLWVITGQLLAFDAVSLKLLYTTNQAPNGRDTLPPVGHFVTQTVANGKVYVGTQHSLEAYGLFHVATITGGNAQTSTAATTLAAPIQVEVDNPYNGQPDVGSTVTVTASSAGLKNVNFVEYSVAGPAANTAITGGNSQIAPAGTQLPEALTVLVTDQCGNPVPGVSVAFDDGGAGGTYSYVNPSITSNSGTATQFYTLPPSPGIITITATVTGVATPAVFTEAGQ